MHNYTVLENIETSNYIHYTVWDEITYPFPNFNIITRQGLKLNHAPASTTWRDKTMKEPISIECTISNTCKDSAVLNSVQLNGTQNTGFVTIN